MKGKQLTDSVKVKPTPVCLPPKLISALDEQADFEGIFSRSAIIRRACQEYLQRHRRKEQPQGREELQ